MGKLTIPVSFKEKEIELFLFIKGKGDQSNYIKDCIKKCMQLEREKAKRKEIKEIADIEIIT